jgi:hypothetical protein
MEILSFRIDPPGSKTNEVCLPLAGKGTGDSTIVRVHIIVRIDKGDEFPLSDFKSSISSGAQSAMRGLKGSRKAVIASGKVLDDRPGIVVRSIVDCNHFEVVEGH